MNSNGLIYSGLIFPVIVNSQVTHYVTNASAQIVASCFNTSETLEEFLEELRLTGHKINKYMPTLLLNFDRK